jgi:hypothetical protein
MRCFRVFGVVGLVVLVFGVVGVAVAVAEEAPYWSIEGTRLAAGKTAEITGKAFGGGTQALTAGTVTVTCTGGKVSKGTVLVGSEPGEPGRGEGRIELSGCTITGNGTKCTVTNGEIKTEPLTGELAYAENKKSLVVEFTPRTGHVLAEPKFTAETGGTCTHGSTKITGLVVAGVFTDPEANSETGEPVLLELGTTVKPSTSFVLKTIAKNKVKIWLIKGGSGVSFETEELDAFGGEAILQAAVLVSLASGLKGSPLL